MGAGVHPPASVPTLESASMSRPPASEPVCLRCELADPAELHAVDLRNTRWRFRARLCDRCYGELMRRRDRWLAEPKAEPGSLRAWRLDHGLSVRELARRTGLSASMVSHIERGKIKSWPRYEERLREAVSRR